MPYNPEKTNAKNIENVHITNNIIGSFGATWNPTNLNILAAAMTTFETDFTASTHTLNQALSVEENAVNEQMAAFKAVPKKVTRLMKAARAQGLSEEFLDDLNTTANRLRGIKITKNTPDNPETPEDESQSNHSVSRRSYAGILDSLDFMIQQLISNPNYKLNEGEYQTPELTAWLAGLQAKHNAALAAKLATRNARDQRNTIAYSGENSLLPRMQMVKNYAETLDLPEGDTRPKQLRKLSFRDLDE